MNFFKRKKEEALSETMTRDEAEQVINSQAIDFLKQMRAELDKQKRDEAKALEIGRKRAEELQRMREKNQAFTEKEAPLKQEEQIIPKKDNLENEKIRNEYEDTRLKELDKMIDFSDGADRKLEIYCKRDSEDCFIQGSEIKGIIDCSLKDDLFYPLDIDKITEISSCNINFDTVNNKAKLVDDNKLKEDYGYYLSQHYANGGNGSFPYQGKIQFEEIMSRFYEKYNENRNSKQF